MIFIPKMKKILLIICLICCVSVCLSAQTVTLTSQNNNVCVTKTGTVTFASSGATLEDIAKKNGLRNISGKTYQAAVIYNSAFSQGYLTARGKIFNCTDNTLNVKCSFYSGSSLIASYNITVKPRTFSRMLPKDVSLSTVSNCNKIVCSEISGGVSSSSSAPTQSSQRSAVSQNSGGKSYFKSQTTFYGEDSSQKTGMTFYSNGTASCVGYVNVGGSWIKGTSQGTYYIQNNCINVVWDDWLSEKYVLNNNTFYHEGILFRVKK